MQPFNDLNNRDLESLNQAEEKITVEFPKDNTFRFKPLFDKRNDEDFVIPGFM